MHVQRHRTKQRHRPVRQRQLQSQITEARALHRRIQSPAPARRHQRLRPTTLQHRVRAPSRIPGLHRQPAQKIRRRPPRKKQHRQPQRHHPYHGKIREKHVLDHTVAQDVQLRSHRRSHFSPPRDVPVQCIQRDCRHRQRHAQQVHPRPMPKRAHRQKSHHHSHQRHFVRRPNHAHLPAPNFATLSTAKVSPFSRPATSSFSTACNPPVTHPGTARQPNPPCVPVTCRHLPYSNCCV